MSITSFSRPSDSDVLLKINQGNKIIDFIGKGCLRQNTDETLYIRTVKIKLGEKEFFKNVIFVKKGITWLFKTIETTEFSGNPCY